MNKFGELHLADNARILTSEIPGKQSRVLLKAQQSQEGSIVSYPKSMPFAIKRAKGAIVEDVDGNYFIDFFSMAGVLNLGHCNPYVLDYVRRQQESLVHALDFPTENKHELTRKILERIPEHLRKDYKVSFCGPSGSDAVEAAIKLAKHYTGRENVIAFQGSYHGMTSGALAATSNRRLREKISSNMPNVTFVPFSYCYRCPVNQNPPNCALECASYLKNILENPHSGIVKPAAVLVEPIQGEGGTVVPKKGYLRELRNITNEHDVVLIFDEIQSGFFRTGKFWAFEEEGVFPDIITMSKGLGGIGFPISAIIYNKRIESWSAGDHIGTFRGNQVSIAAGNGALDFVKEFDLAQHVQEQGQYMLEQLELLKADFPCIGEVRGEGLFIGLEYVKDPETKVPDTEIIAKLRAACLQKGLLFESGGHYDNVIRFIPPLIVTREIIDSALKIFRRAHEELMAEKGYVAQLV